jgi:hypothetical protein
MKQSPPIRSSSRGICPNENLNFVWHPIADYSESRSLFDIEAAEERVVGGAIRGLRETCTRICDDSSKRSSDNPVTHTSASLLIDDHAFEGIRTLTLEQYLITLHLVHDLTFKPERPISHMRAAALMDLPIHCRQLSHVTERWLSLTKHICSFQKISCPSSTRLIETRPKPAPGTWDFLTQSCADPWKSCKNKESRWVSWTAEGI